MNNKLKQLFLLREMHSFQVIAVVGFVMSALAQLLMYFSGRQIDSFGYIYPTWAIIFLIGFLLNLTSKNENHHTH